MNVLSIDLGHKTGWCLGPNDYGTYVSPGETIGEELFNWGKEIEPKIHGAVQSDKDKSVYFYSCADLVVYERPHLRGWAASFSLVGRAALLELLSFYGGVKTKSVHSATIKKFITGSGRATKADVIKAVKKRGFKPKDDHQADAIALWLYARERFSGESE